MKESADSYYVDISNPAGSPNPSKIDLLRLTALPWTQPPP